MIRRSLLPAVLAVAALLPLPAAAQQEVDITGTWALAMEGPQGMVNMTLNLKQEDAKITGTMDGPMGMIELAGEVDAADVVFWGTIEGGNGSFELVFSGTVGDDKKLSGMMEAGGGEFSTEFTAERVEKG